MLRRVYTLRLVEPILDAVPLVRDYDIFIKVKHDIKDVRVENTIRDYCEHRVVIPRIQRVFRDIYPDYDISVYDA